MKRYNCTDTGSTYESYGEPIMQESPTGDYVLYADVQKLVELIKEANSTVRTHAMQTYSKISARLADEIDESLKELGVEL